MPQLVEGQPVSDFRSDTVTRPTPAMREAMAQAPVGDDVFADDPTVNAWCLPGGYIGFYSGILPTLKNESGMAFVMGHEVGHAIAKHGAERMSQQIGVIAFQPIGSAWRNIDKMALGVARPQPGESSRLEIVKDPDPATLVRLPDDGNTAVTANETIQNAIVINGDIVVAGTTSNALCEWRRPTIVADL